MGRPRPKPHAVAIGMLDRSRGLTPGPQTTILARSPLTLGALLPGMHPSFVVRLAALEGGGSSSAGAVDVAQYVAALQELRGVLGKAKEEQERLEGELAQVGGQWTQHPWLLLFQPAVVHPCGRRGAWLPQVPTAGRYISS